MLGQLSFNNCFLTELFTPLMLLELIFAFFAIEGYIGMLKHEGFFFNRKIQFADLLENLSSLTVTKEDCVLLRLQMIFLQQLLKLGDHLSQLKISS